MFQGTQTELFAEYNLWMNEKLYAAAAQLTDAQRKRDLGAFFKSLHGTLDHILWGDTAWLARLQGRQVTLPAAGTIMHDDFGALSLARTELDRQILAWSKSVTAEWLAQPHTWKSTVYATTFTHPNWALCAQMFNHQTHHRGQATTLLMQLGIDPGVTDIPMLPALNV
jgi:uncharacterized damage-inducible protein DinB